MAATKAPPAPIRTPAEPVLGLFYNVRAAAVRLGLTDPTDPGDTTGQRWLRDGFNRPFDGSKGRKFPGRYMGRELIFSEADLAVIDEIAREETEERLKAKEQPPVSTGRPRRVRRTTKTPASA
ncbi:hypothetical protein PV755_43330 [Streptomyces caniscabiei]|uniref:hypothetical protein n=1 Tax=Streptomyces caniscabiei TaxID=2746961 RepID=UPI0029ACC326|nr:hypothetical protein [Streptomyces caniscabiei]MDX3515658.1 hypothetical protein [Streptomyces caniscabiei]MDX3724877.1 hypothetical protein [Streptomyces caniscabiei]